MDAFADSLQMHFLVTGLLEGCQNRFSSAGGFGGVARYGPAGRLAAQELWVAVCARPARLPVRGHAR